MPRRRIKISVLAGLLLAVSGCGGDEGGDGFVRPAVREPNVVVVMTDDQATDTLKAMPYTRRALGRAGTRFAHAYASFPLCCPSRATFLTGQYAHNHGVLDNDPPDGGISALDQAHTLPVWLSDAGYATGFMGKYLNGYGNPENGGPLFIPPGWDYWVSSGSEHAAFEYRLNENGSDVVYGSAPADYRTDVLARHAVTFIDRYAAARRPFFLWVATSAPHTEELPLQVSRDPTPAPRHRGSFEKQRLPRGAGFDEADVSDKPAFVQALPRLRARQRALMRRTYVSQLESLRAVDELVRSIVRKLRASGELRRTLLVFTSDNGFMRGQHRLGSGKSLPYEESIGVPLFVRGPGFPVGRNVDQPVGNVDLAPTVLAAASAEADVAVDGVPLQEVAKGDREPPPVLLEVRNRGADHFTGLRSQDLVYIERGRDRSELYDLATDPAELENQISNDDYADDLARLQELLSTLRECAGKTCR